jgi:uncharacterized protein (TIGR02996 family)
MAHHEGFLRSIIDNPDDDAPRLIYADWLDDHGQPERAEFIRVQCRLAELDEDDPERRGLQRREYELLADHWGEWAGPLVGRAYRWWFQRGFVEQVKMEAGQFLKEARWLLDFAPIQGLVVNYPKSEELRALLVSRHIRRITRLYLNHAELGDSGASLVAQAPSLSQLTHLSLWFNHIGRRGLLALAKSPYLTSLRWIDVSGNELPRNALGEFAAACRLPLESLSWEDEIAPEGIRRLVASPLAGHLKKLHLSAADVRTEGVRLLAKSPAFIRLEELIVESNEIGAAGICALGTAPFLRQLVSLNLQGGRIGDQGATALARSAAAPSLRRLDLSFNDIGPDGAKALANSSLCGSLTRLVLDGNPIGDRGVGSLARSLRLGDVRRLGLYGCRITRQGTRAMLSSPHLGRLTCLRLEGNRIGRKAFDALHSRLGERLFHEHFNDGLDGPEIIRRVKAEPPRCLRGLGARPDTELIRRFPRGTRLDADFACIAFELTHPDPRQKATLLGFDDPRGPNGDNLFFSPYAIRWEPSGEQREFFDAEQHGLSGELGGNCTIVGLGKRRPWTCDRRRCREHTFIVTFIYNLDSPPGRPTDGHLPFADQFYHIDLDAYCASQDRVIEIASDECK